MKPEKSGEGNGMVKSRRNFLKSSLVAGAVAGAAGMGVVPAIMAQEKESQATPAKPKYSWEVVPEPIPSSKITKTVEADVVIVGPASRGSAPRMPRL
jgi:hypothetical protein